MTVYFMGLGVIIYLAFTMLVTITFRRDTRLPFWECLAIGLIMPLLLIVVSLPESYFRWRRKRLGGVRRGYEENPREEPLGSRQP